MRYICITYPIIRYGVLFCTTTVINARVIRPVVSFKNNWVVPAIICWIAVVCVNAIIYKVIEENKAVVRREIDTVFVVADIITCNNIIVAGRVDAVFVVVADIITCNNIIVVAGRVDAIVVIYEIIAVDFVVAGINKANAVVVVFADSIRCNVII